MIVSEQPNSCETVCFTDQLLRVSDLRNSITASALKIYIERCESKEWPEIAGEIKKHKCLQELGISNCDTGDAICQNLGDMKRLKRLSLTSCQLTDRAADHLIKLANLATLRLCKISSQEEDNPAMTTTAFRRFLNCLRKLESLDLHINAPDKLLASACGVGFIQLGFITQNLKGLKILILDRNNLGVEGVAIIARQLKQLTKLNVDHNSLGAEGARLIASKLPQLKDLSIDNNKLGYEGIRMIATGLPRLEILNIDRNLVAVHGLQLVVRNMIYLRELSARCNCLSQHSIKRIREYLPKVKVHSIYK